MSNTLNTPIEALELEFPLRVVEYSLRRGSGGRGRFDGGDGVIRELEALVAAELLADHRAPPPRPRPAPTAASPALQGATCSTARSSRRRSPGGSRPGSGCGSRRPAAAGTAPHAGALGCTAPDADRVSRTRDHGLADGREPGSRRVRADRLEPHHRHRGGVLRRASRGSSGGDARGGGAPAPMWS